METKSYRHWNRWVLLQVANGEWREVRTDRGSGKGMLLLVLGCFFLKEMGIFKQERDVSFVAYKDHWPQCERWLKGRNKTETLGECCYCKHTKNKEEQRQMWKEGPPWIDRWEMELMNLCDRMWGWGRERSWRWFSGLGVTGSYMMESSTEIWVVERRSVSREKVSVLDLRSLDTCETSDWKWEWNVGYLSLELKRGRTEREIQANSGFVSR